MRIPRILRTLLLTILALALPTSAFAQVSIGIEVGFGPPPIPVYAQPVLYQPNEIWQPGYWAWGPAGYFWVPGTWVAAPQPGLLWTPGYWAWNNGSFFFQNGYWGATVGFYGGV